MSQAGSAAADREAGGRQAVARSWRSPTPRFTRSRDRRSSSGTIVLRGAKIEALGAGIPVPAGAQDRRRGGRGRLSRLHQCPHADGAERTGTARVRRRQRDARPQPAAPDSRRVSLRERRHRGRAHQRHHDRRRHARRRHLRRRGRGHEPRRLDVGGSDAQGQTPASRSTSRPSAAAAAAVAAEDAAAAAPRVRPTKT